MLAILWGDFKGLFSAFQKFGLVKLLHPRDYLLVFRFNIEKKLKLAKRKEQRKRNRGGGGKGSPRGSVSSMRDLEVNPVSQRSADRRKDMKSNRKDNKKMSALDELKAKREEKKKLQGTSGRGEERWGGETLCIHIVIYFVYKRK